MAIDLAAHRIVVTGGAGFLGRAIVRTLQERGCREVFVPRSADYDLTRQEAVRRLYQEHTPEIVIHAAGVVGGIGANRLHPGVFYYKNLIMGAELIEQARLNGVEKFVALGTICAYPKFTPVPFCEEDLWNGYPEETNAPYAIAKKVMAVQLQAYRDEFGFSGIYLLPVNLYGPGDNFDLESSHVIPAMIRKFLDARRRDERQVVLWGDGSPTREFLYVDDAAEAVVLAAEKYESHQPMNIGAGFEISMRDLAEIIRSQIGYQGEVIWDASKPNGQPRRMLDTSRARQEIGFAASTSLEAGLKATIDWYLGQQKGS
jgi:GDP-L-fucose synthase